MTYLVPDLRSGKGRRDTVNSVRRISTTEPAASQAMWKRWACVGDLVAVTAVHWFLVGCTHWRIALDRRSTAHRGRRLARVDRR